MDFAADPRRAILPFLSAHHDSAHHIHISNDSRDFGHCDDGARQIKFKLHLHRSSSRAQSLRVYNNYQLVRHTTRTTIYYLLLLGCAGALGSIAGGGGVANTGPRDISVRLARAQCWERTLSLSLSERDQARRTSR